MMVIVDEFGAPTKSGVTVEIVTKNDSSPSMKKSSIISTSKHSLSPGLASLGKVTELVERIKSSFSVNSTRHGNNY